MVRHHVLDKPFIGFGQLVVTTLISDLIPGISGIEVILATFTLHHLTGFGNFDALGDRFVCLLFHNWSLRFLKIGLRY